MSFFSFFEFLDFKRYGAMRSHDISVCLKGIVTAYIFAVFWSVLLVLPIMLIVEGRGDLAERLLGVVFALPLFLLVAFPVGVIAAFPCLLICLILSVEYRVLGIDDMFRWAFMGGLIAGVNGYFLMEEYWVMFSVAGFFGGYKMWGLCRPRFVQY